MAGTQALQARYKGAKPAELEQRTDLTVDFVKAIVRGGLNSMPFFRPTELSDDDLGALGAYLTRKQRYAQRLRSWRPTAITPMRTPRDCPKTPTRRGPRGDCRALAMLSASIAPWCTSLAGGGRRDVRHRPRRQRHADRRARRPGRAADAPTVLIVGGLDGDNATAAAVRTAVASYEKLHARDRAFNLLAVPVANPERAALEFPPTGVAYREHSESHALWRWIGTHGPDLVLIAGTNAARGAPSSSAQALALGTQRARARGTLAAHRPTRSPPR